MHKENRDEQDPADRRGAEQAQGRIAAAEDKERPRVIAAIAEARAHGDLKENAEYHAAREEQGFIEGRIKEIESKLSNAQIIDVTNLNAGGKVVFGATVDLVDEDTGAEVTYQIVGDDEADIKQGMISINPPSPVP
jgi:transcription elongation factor GreA